MTLLLPTLTVRSKNSQGELFDRNFPLHWLPGESLYSLCSRFHASSGRSTARASNMTLFGVPSEAAYWDFPLNVNEIVKRSNGTLGSAEQILRDRCLSGAFLPLLSPERAGRAMELMKFGRCQSNQRSACVALGAGNNGLRQSRCLRYCPACVQEDLVRPGIPYWRIFHQYPGTRKCPDHGCSLQIQNLAHRAGYVLPPKTRARSRAQSMPRVEQEEIVQFWLQYRLACGVLPQFDLPTIQATIVASIRKVPAAARHARTRFHQGAINAYVETCRRWSKIPGLELLQVDDANAKRQFRHLLHQERTNIHPLRLGAISFGIYGSFQEFLKSYSTFERRII